MSIIATRVKCQGNWHQISLVDGKLSTECQFDRCGEIRGLWKYPRKSLSGKPSSRLPKTLREAWQQTYETFYSRWEKTLLDKRTFSEHAFSDPGNVNALSEQRERQAEAKERGWSFPAARGKRNIEERKAAVSCRRYNDPEICLWKGDWIRFQQVLDFFNGRRLSWDLKQILFQTTEDNHYRNLERALYIGKDSIVIIPSRICNNEPGFIVGRNMKIRLLHPLR